MLPLLALAPLLTFGASSNVRYELELRTEARVGTGSGAPLLATALDLLPRGGLMLQNGGLELEGAYSPRLSFSNTTPGAAPDLLHRAELGLTYQFSASRRLSLQEDATYGIRDFSPLSLGTDSGVTPSPTPAPPLEPLPELRTAPYVSSSTVLSLAYGLSPLWSVTASGGFDISGGADSETRSFIPLQRGPRLDFQLVHQAGRSDTLGTQLAASDHMFSTGRRATVALLTQRWEHRFTGTSKVELRGGVSGARGQEGALRPAISILPVVGGGMEAQLSLAGRPLHARLTVDLMPYVDPLAGVVYQRVEGGPAVAWLFQDLALGLRLTGSTVVTGYERRGQTLVTGDVAASYLLARRVRLDMGVRGAYQAGLLVTGPALQWGAFAGLSFRETGPI